MSRLTLPNGDWVDLVDRLNYAQAHRLQMSVGTTDEPGTLVAALVTNWALRDTDDQPIDFPGAGAEGIPLDALSRIPFDTFQTVAKRVMEILPGQPDPKGTAGTSTGSQPEGKSGSRRISQKRTSSKTTQAGPIATWNGHPQT